MHKGKDMKRTGVYRVSGNIADFQLLLKLRHISEWLPVPKLEYNGAQGTGEQPETDEDRWSDCLIHIPQDDDVYGSGRNRIGYYGCYYSFPSGGGSASHPVTAMVRRRKSPRSPRAIEAPPEEQAEENLKKKDESDEAEEKKEVAKKLPAIKAPESHKDGSHESQEAVYQDPQRTSFPENSADMFYERNRELCNGAMASICISWQQKYFSHPELQRQLADLGACASKAQKRYHNWALEIQNLQQLHLQKLEQQRERIQEREQDLERMRVRRKPRKTRPLRPRPGVTALTTMLVSNGLSSASTSEVSLADDPHFAARTCLVYTLVDGDSEDMLPREAHDIKTKGHQLMYVYADLQQKTLLVTLRYDPVQGLLYVYPDFSASAQDLDYVVVVERENDCRQLYAYGFENATPLQLVKMVENVRQDGEESETDSEDAEDIPGDRTALELLDYHQRQRLDATELRYLLHFDMPPKRMRRICVLLELQEAQFFERPNIHVRYYVQPPQHTIWESSMGTGADDPLRGSTATCRNAGDFRLANLGHCWQVTLLCEEHYQPNELMHIYFEVVSIDFWQRERCEGYAHYSCSLISPLTSETVKMQCIRPLGSWLDSLNRYFIGGRKLFDFVSYFDAQNAEKDIHNRLNLDPGRAMRSTGYLVLHIQKLQQRHVENSVGQLQLDLCDSSTEASGSDEDAKSGSMTDTARATTLDEVMTAYVEARERIESLLGRAIEA
ncbi:hypothetical protein KR026_010565 [Drosophila bipectinata]|nr:hypothetical protein KR026_010565 [Drosophila bipectinata]